MRLDGSGHCVASLLYRPQWVESGQRLNLLRRVNANGRNHLRGSNGRFDRRVGRDAIQRSFLGAFSGQCRHRSRVCRVLLQVPATSLGLMSAVGGKPTSAHLRAFAAAAGFVNRGANIPAIRLHGDGIEVVVHVRDIVEQVGQFGAEIAEGLAERPPSLLVRR